MPALLFHEWLLHPMPRAWVWPSTGGSCDSARTPVASSVSLTGAGQGLDGDYVEKTLGGDMVSVPFFVALSAVAQRAANLAV